VELARSSVGTGHWIAGSIAPLEDCYRPDLSPDDPRPEHREMAICLANAGVDLLLCETFPHVGEALIAVEEAAATGLPVWVSFTAGPKGDLLSPQEVFRAAKEAIARGAQAVLVNCVPASTTLDWLRPLVDLGVPFGAYANAGHQDENLGWHADPQDSASRYADIAQDWVRAGATLIGSCCGTGPAHTAELALRFGESNPTPLPR
jgi:S-methylmethionine-dependent homocysteine/selenocysteine methylase